MAEGQEEGVTGLLRVALLQGLIWALALRAALAEPPTKAAVAQAEVVKD